MADGSIRERRRGRWQYRAADDALAEIEAYAAACRDDPRAQIPILARAVEDRAAAIRAYLDDAEGLVEIAHRAARSQDSASSLAAAMATHLEPELAVVEFAELHRDLMLLELALAMPADELEKIAQHDERPEIGVLDLAPDHDRLASLLAVSLRRKRQLGEFADLSNQTKHEEKLQREERWRREDALLAKERPHVTKKNRRAALIRKRLGESYSVDCISRALPKR